MHCHDGMYFDEWSSQRSFAELFFFCTLQKCGDAIACIPIATAFAVALDPELHTFVKNGKLDKSRLDEAQRFGRTSGAPDDTLVAHALMHRVRVMVHSPDGCREATTSLSSDPTKKLLHLFREADGQVSPLISSRCAHFRIEVAADAEDADGAVIAEKNDEDTAAAAAAAAAAAKKKDEETAAAAAAATKTNDAVDAAAAANKKQEEDAVTAATTAAAAAKKKRDVAAAAAKKKDEEDAAAAAAAANKKKKKKEVAAATSKKKKEDADKLDEDYTDDAGEDDEVDDNTAEKKIKKKWFPTEQVAEDSKSRYWKVLQERNGPRYIIFRTIVKNSKDKKDVEYWVGAIRTARRGTKVTIDAVSEDGTLRAIQSVDLKYVRDVQVTQETRILIESSLARRNHKRKDHEKEEAAANASDRRPKRARRGSSKTEAVDDAKTEPSLSSGQSFLSLSFSLSLSRLSRHQLDTFFCRHLQVCASLEHLHGRLCR